MKPKVKPTAKERKVVEAKGKTKADPVNRDKTHPAGWGAKCSAGLKEFHKNPEKQKAAAEYHKLHPEAKIRAAAYRARKREEAAAAAKVAKKVEVAKVTKKAVPKSGVKPDGL